MTAQSVEAIRVNSLLADAAVYALQTGQDRYFVAERLPSFGSVIVEPLQALLNESPDDEVQVLAALVLLRLGSKAGIPILLNAVLTEPADRYASLVVERLAANRVSEASEAIMTRLRRFSPADVDLGKSFESNPNKDFVVTALHALQELAVALPEDLAGQFTVPSIPIEITSVLSLGKALE